MNVAAMLRQYTHPKEVSSEKGQKSALFVNIKFDVTIRNYTHPKEVK